MQALILAGGLGTRLGELTKTKPKPMMDFNGKPFLEILIEWLKKSGVTEIVITSGYLGGIIEKHFADGSRFGVRIKYALEKELLGTGGAIKNAEPLLNEDFFVLNGDSFCNINLRKLRDFHLKSKAEFTIALAEAPNEDCDVIESDKNGKVKALLHRGTNEAAEYRKKHKASVNAGVYYFSKSALSFIPSGKNASLETEILPLLIQRGTAYALSFDATIIDIGTPERYKNAVNLFN